LDKIYIINSKSLRHHASVWINNLNYGLKGKWIVIKERIYIKS